MPSKRHVLRVGTLTFEGDELPEDRDFRKDVEPWLSSVLQSEHLSLLVGSGITLGIGSLAGVGATGMEPIALNLEDDTQLPALIEAHADRSAKEVGRGKANIEDQIRSALGLLTGLEILGDPRCSALRDGLNRLLTEFLSAILQTEVGLFESFESASEKGMRAQQVLASFLLTFASRLASRERLHLFTTNYDRLLEYGCDLAGLRVVDRFVGVLSPIFRSSRIDVDLHYNPPGIRGEPRYLEGVIRFGKLHGSLDWQARGADIYRIGVPFGAAPGHPDIPKAPINTVMIYPNPAKDIETFDYPYAELFRDFSAATCRPNAALVTYGYGYGDDHLNRVIRHMLTLPSTHLVIIAFDDRDERIANFCAVVGRSAQISLLIGPTFGAIDSLVDRYLPKPAVDRINIRQTELRMRRGEAAASQTEAEK